MNKIYLRFVHSYVCKIGVLGFFAILSCATLRAEVSYVSFLGLNSLKLHSVVRMELADKAPLIGVASLYQINATALIFKLDLSISAEQLVQELNRQSLVHYDLQSAVKNTIFIALRQDSFDPYKLHHALSPNVDYDLSKQLFRFNPDIVAYSESESNNNFYLSNYIDGQEYIVGTLNSRDDQDFFFLPLTSVAQVTIYKLSNTSYRPQVRVFDSSFSIIHDFSLLLDNSLQITFSANQDVVYLQIFDALGPLPLEIGRIEPYNYLLKIE